MQSNDSRKAIKISKMTVDDLQDVMQLAKEAHEQSVFAALPFSPRKFREHFQRILDEPQQHLGLTAKVRGRTVSFIYVHLGEYYIADGGLIASVNSLFVTRSLQQSLLGGKIALRLVQAVQKWAMTQKAQWVLFSVTSGVNLAKTDSFFRKTKFLALGGNYALLL